MRENSSLHKKILIKLDVMPKLSIQNEELLTQVEEIANLGSYETDLTKGTWIGSDNFLKIFGLPRKEQYMQEEFQAIVHPDDFENVMNYFHQCLDEQKDFNYEYRCIRPDGKVICVSSRSKITYDKEGVPQKIIGIKQDITERKRFEQQLRQLNKLIEKKDEILGEVAHDLRAPLAQIMMIAHLLEEKLQGEQRELFSLLKETCQTTDTIISELIEIAELEKFSHDLNRVHVNLNDIVKRAINCYRLRLEEKDLELKTTLDPRANAYVDEKKILRLVDNLLDNAIKFTPEKHSIHILTKMKNDRLLLVVEDDGIGIKKEHLPFLFDPHSKPIRRQGTNGEHSTGLGLNIVKQIVDLHNANIEVTSNFNEGTRFTVIFEPGKF